MAMSKTVVTKEDAGSIHWDMRFVAINLASLLDFV